MTVLILAFKMPEVWSIDHNGTISRRRELILKSEGLLGLSAAAGGSKGQSRPTALKNGLNQYRRIRAGHVGVWGSASFVGRDQNLIACAEGGELVP